MATLTIIFSVIAIITLTAGAFFPLWRDDLNKANNEEKKED